MDFMALPTGTKYRLSLLEGQQISRRRGYEVEFIVGALVVFLAGVWVGLIW